MSDYMDVFPRFDRLLYGNPRKQFEGFTFQGCSTIFEELSQNSDDALGQLGTFFVPFQGWAVDEGTVSLGPDIPRHSWCLRQVVRPEVNPYFDIRPEHYNRILFPYKMNYFPEKVDVIRVDYHSSYIEKAMKDVDNTVIEALLLVFFVSLMMVRNLYWKLLLLMSL